MPNHLEVYQFQQGRGLEIYNPCASVYEAISALVPSSALTHVLAANLGPAFFQTVLYVFLLVSLVVPQPSDEVVEGFLEPAVSLSAGLAHVSGAEGETNMATASQPGHNGRS